MAKCINKIMLIGYLGEDPELRYQADGTAVTTMSLATSETWRCRKTKKLQKRTDWHRVVLVSRLAEFAVNYLKKGNKVYIEGCLQYRLVERYGESIKVAEIQGKEMQLFQAPLVAPSELTTEKTAV